MGCIERSTTRHMCAAASLKSSRLNFETFYPLKAVLHLVVKVWKKSTKFPFLNIGHVVSEHGLVL